ncbi:MAG: helix-turn-helix domain-containing protein [Bacillus sp. (in: Bacteria)]|nr:helix-turn-helix domain-containing protein [Bacillus sp. (in: firmicutes)]
MLGERIRKLRKQKKMTLEALAGAGLSKGMLSLIENNKAKPSMESLAYIAAGLEVDVSDLLEEISKRELREILERAEKLYNKESEIVTTKYKQLITLIKPHIKKLAHGYESARLLDIYSCCLYHEKLAGWQDFMNEAATMYDKMNLTANRAAIAIFRALEKFSEHDYKNSLDILVRERAEIELNHAYIDPMTKIDLDYHEAIIQFAVGEDDSATLMMENAINFSKEHRIFYHIDDLYRLAAGQALMSHNGEKKELYLKKLKQYGDFADDIASIIVHDLIIAMSLTSEKQEYIKALEIIDNYLSNPKMKEIYEFLYLIEKGKALYGLGHFNEAIVYLEKVTTPLNMHHPFDLSLFYIRDSYKALCHLRLGTMEAALQSAKIAVGNFETLPHTSFKEFAVETYNAIVAKIN